MQKCTQEFPQLKEKGIDVSIAVDMVVAGMKNAFDVGILVSGDSDFIPAIKELQSIGKQVEVAQFKSVISWNLRKKANRVYELDDYFDELILE